MKKILSLSLGLMIMASHSVKAVDSKLVIGGSVIGSALLLKCYHSFIVKDYVKIKTMKDTFKQKNCMHTDGEAIIEIYNWNNQNYPTARAVKAAEQLCVDALVADAMSGKLIAINPADYTTFNGELHWQVAQRIEQQLNEDMQTLRRSLDELYPYIHYQGYSFKQYLGYTGYSFAIDYCAELEKVCKEQHANVNDPATWSQAQEQAIDAYMRAAATTGTIKFLRGYAHYGQAARLYWDMFKKHARLIAIKQALVKDIRFLKAKEQQALNVNLHNYNHPVE